MDSTSLLDATYSVIEDALEGVSLDPGNNNSTDGALAPDGGPWRGWFKRRYRASFNDPTWGTAKGGCGVLTIVTRTPGGVKLQPALCRNWSCVPCGTMRASWLKRQLQDQVLSGKLRSFWTLTIRTSTCTAAESYYHVTASWNRLRTALARKYGRFEYAWTREATKAGYAHLHLLISLELDAELLSEMWLKATRGSWIVDVQPVESERAANYISKYCVEQATDRQEIAAFKGSKLRVFSKSKGITFEPFMAPGKGESVVVALPYRDAERLAKSRATGVIRGARALPWIEVNLDAWPGPVPAAQEESL